MPRSDLTTIAYGAASRAATDIYNGVVSSLRERIKAGEFESAEDDALNDAIHEDVDGALIYTADQYTCVWGLRDQGDAIEEGLCSKPSSFSDVLAAQAYCNLRAEVASHDFSDDFQVLEDQREESERTHLDSGPQALTTPLCGVVIGDCTSDIDFVTCDACTKAHEERGE